MSSIYLTTEIYVEIKQMVGEDAPRPLPLSKGFSENKLYKVYGIETHSETSEAYFILVNDKNEFWWISNRHIRFVK